MTRKEFRRDLLAAIKTEGYEGTVTVAGREIAYAAMCSGHIPGTGPMHLTYRAANRPAWGYWAERINECTRGAIDIYFGRAQPYEPIAPGERTGAVEFVRDHYVAKARAARLGGAS